jgi:hypothetical protein
MERKEKEKIFYIHMAKPLFGSILAFIHCFGIVKYNDYRHFYCFLEVSRAPQQPKVGQKNVKEVRQEEVGKRGLDIVVYNLNKG